jgi:hypothetical protein
VNICAADLSAFALPGSGRLGVGLYVAHLNRWVGDGPFSRDSLLVLRRESMRELKSRETSLLRVLSHLDLSQPTSTSSKEFRRAWEVMTRELPPQNVWKRDRDPMLKDSKTQLRKFYRVFGEALVNLLSLNCDQKAPLQHIQQQCKQDNDEIARFSYSITVNEDDDDDEGKRLGSSRRLMDLNLRKWSPNTKPQLTPPRYGCGSDHEPLIPMNMEMTALLINNKFLGHDPNSMKLRLFSIVPYNADDDRFAISINSEYGVSWHHPFGVEGTDHVELSKWSVMKDCLLANDWCVYLHANAVILKHSSDWLYDKVLELDREKSDVFIHFFSEQFSASLIMKSCEASLSWIDSTMIRGLLAGKKEESELLFTTKHFHWWKEESTRSEFIDRVRSPLVALEYLRGLCRGEQDFKRTTNSSAHHFDVVVVEEEELEVSGDMLDDGLIWN